MAQPAQAQPQPTISKRTPLLASFRDRISDAQYEYWLAKSTDGKGNNTHLEILLAEYARLNIDPMTCLIVLNVRSSYNKNTESKDLKPALTVTLKALLVLCERDPNYGGVKHGEIVMTAEGKLPFSCTGIAIRKDTGAEIPATRFYGEVVQTFNNKPTSLWDKQPIHMTMKCALTTAVQLAFPTVCAGLTIADDFAPLQDEHEGPSALPPALAAAPPAADPVRQFVDTSTGEVFQNRTPAASPEPAKPVERTAQYTIGAGARIHNPSEAATSGEAPASPGNENAPKARSQAFEKLTSDSVRRELVRQIYDIMKINAQAVDEGQHRMTMRIVAGMAKVDPIPSRWVDFEVSVLGDYISRQGQPIEETPPKEKASKPPAVASNGQGPMTSAQDAFFSRALRKRQITVSQLEPFIRKVTSERTGRFSELTESEAEKAIGILSDFLAQKELQAANGAPRS